ncbi:hypothetical protein GE09DRAFT_953867 [Coniochaeta sp. 2T2.1]|nr:hypothetical protein GE09DRAFT_953867 [Coniochaeta sp. 2T2.1]
MRILTHTRNIALVPAVQCLALSGALWLLLFVYCNFALWRDPHGAYFHSEGVYDLGYSAVRQQEAREFIRQYADYDAKTNSPPSPERAGPHPALCAAFVTVRRDHPDAALYFADSVGSMLAGLSERERAVINLRVLFANGVAPEVHPDYKSPWVQAVFDHASGYEGYTDEDMDELRFREGTGDYQSKGVHDYTYMLEDCYNKTDAPFIAVFEDDIVFAGDWLARTLLGLEYLATAKEEKDREGWLYLRLFYSETYMKWDAEKDWWYGHLFVTLTLVSLTVGTVLVLLRMMLRRTLLNLRLDTHTITVLALLVAPGFTALAFMAGKYNLPMYAFRGSPAAVGSLLVADEFDRALQRNAGVVAMEHQACCSQALVFDRARVPELIDYLRGSGRGQTDLMIEEYCAAKPLRRFALGEQAVQHLGIRSSRGGAGVQGNSVWAFYFEELKREEVERRRREALGRIDWGVFERLRGS